MEKNVFKLVFSFFSVTILIVTLLPFYTVGFCQTDTTPPELTILNKFLYTCDQQIILHGHCSDDSGIQNVTVNSVNATGWVNANHFFWQSPVSLAVGYNTITVTAYDDSSNHNEVEEEFIIICQTVTYEGPTVELIPVENQPLNNITIQCVVNPNEYGKVYLWYSSSSFENAPFGQSIYLGTFSGSKDILLNYTLQDPLLHEGDDVSYLIQTANYASIDFSDVETFKLTEGNPTVDTNSPVIYVTPDLYEEYNTPNSQITFLGSAWDESGIKNITVNGELVTGMPQGEWFDWEKTLNLTEGVNEVEILAYDDSPNNFMSQKTFKITYQPSGYSGPTIDWLLPTNITLNSVTLNCVVNPQISPNPAVSEYVKVFVQYYPRSDIENATLLYGEHLGLLYSGFDDIPLSFQLESENTQSRIFFTFWAANSKGVAFTDVVTLTLKPGLVDFSVTPQTPYENEAITFNGSSCYSPYGSIVSYQFDFGDGNTTETESPIISHVYQTSGTFDVTLKIVDDYGVTNSTTKTVTVLSDSAAPNTSDNYDGLWHNSDFEIALSAVDSESGVADIHYKINQGTEKIVSKDGQPKITTESENNKLQFWSVDNSGNVEDAQLISGIKLDKTNPIAGNLVISPESEIQEDQTVQVLVAVSDSDSGIEDVTLSYSTDNQSTWNDVSMVLNSTSDLWQATIPGQQLWTQVNYKVTAHDVAGNSASTQTQTNSYEVIPEFSSWIVLPIFVLATITIIVSRKRLNKTKN